MDAMIKSWHDNVVLRVGGRLTRALFFVIAGLDPAIHGIASPQ